MATLCDSVVHETPAAAEHAVTIIWSRGGSNTHRVLCDDCTTTLRCAAVDSGLYRDIRVEPLHFHVIGVKGFHPNNTWERRPDGLYVHTGSVYAFTDAQIQACGTTH